MMNFLEVVGLCLGAFLCFLCTISDLRDGVIHNRVLAYFLILAAGINIAYYGYFARDLLLDFLFNLAVVTAVSLYLFYSHSFAGGDCKMTVVLAMLFPARYYVVYGNSNTTLVLAIGFAIFAGYIYLLVSSIQAILTKKVVISAGYIKGFLLNFLKSYIAAMVYIALLNCVLILCERLSFFINVWIASFLCMMVAWCVGRFPVLKTKVFLIPVIITVLAASVIYKMMPISLTPGSYTLVLILLICQMTIKTTIYEKVRVVGLEKGMILSTLSSLLMQSSITKGLPGVSTEDLRSRLTLEEIESIKLWARATHTESLTIVKKIPFAIFISIGFLSYFFYGVF